MKSLRTVVFDRRGNVAVVFALLIPVFVTVASMAVDGARVEASKWSMQRSLDAAALGAAKEFGRTRDDREIERMAQAIFFANEGRPEGDTTRLEYEGVTRVDGNNVLRLTATRVEGTHLGGAVKALTGGRIDFERWPLAVSSQIVVKNRSIELALVLDNSGSMEDRPSGGGVAKMSTLKTATERLIDQMLIARPEANAEDPVRISVVPFAGSVNVGSQHASASWMDTRGVNPAHHDDLDWSNLPPGRTGTPLTRFALFDHLASRFGSSWRWAGCVASRPDGHAITDAAPDARTPATLFMPLFSPSEHYWMGSFSSVRNAYIRDTTRTWNDTDALRRQRDVRRYYEGTEDRDAPGPNAQCTTTPLTPLSASRTTALAAIRAMHPKGGTNIAEGLAWGWRTLTDGEPFTEGRPRDTKENLKVVILMTDGENTYNSSYVNGPQIEITNANRSQYGTYGYGQILGPDGRTRVGRMFDATSATRARSNIASITAAMNETMSLTCENMKNDGRNDDGGDGIVIFAIAFDLEDGSPVKERLRSCASNGIDGRGSKLYYDARNSNDLLAAFGAITDEISALRIAH